MILHLLLAAALLADNRLVFTKVFPRSAPPYVGITVEQSGAAEFRTEPKDDNPVKFQLSSEEAAALFDAANKVNLSNRLESPAKVANMGQKTIRYEKGNGAGEQTFNFTENEDARVLTDWFERISESEQRYIDLERTAKYDKVGVNQALLELQASWERKRLVACRQFVPLLERVAKGESYMQIARNRAAALADLFNKPAAP